MAKLENENLYFGCVLHVKLVCNYLIILLFVSNTHEISQHTVTLSFDKDVCVKFISAQTGVELMALYLAIVNYCSCWCSVKSNLVLTSNS